MAKKTLHFRVDTMKLLIEIVDHGLRPGMGVLRVPLNTFRVLLGQVAQRCTELNDPVLNRLMFDLTLYELPSPTKPEWRKIMKASVFSRTEVLKTKANQQTKMTKREQDHHNRLRMRALKLGTQLLNFRVAASKNKLMAPLLDSIAITNASITLSDCYLKTELDAK